VHNALGQPEKALEHSARGLDVIHKNGEVVVDEAFLNLTIANSTRLLENREAYDRAIRRADELAELWTDAGFNVWYAIDRANVDWALAKRGMAPVVPDPFWPWFVLPSHASS
jgi:hypothetical protein